MGLVELKIKDPKKLKLYRELKNTLLVIVGSIILAFASAVFLTPSDIVSGGILSIGILFNAWIEGATGFQAYDIIVGITQALFWFLGLIFVGKKFSLRTLLSTVAYPVFYSLFLRLNLVEALNLIADPSSYGKLLLLGLFGGFLTGAGVAISYLGNGSTGGVDVISRILKKYFHVKEDISSFAIDATLIIIGMIVFQDVFKGLVGIITALCCALAIQFIYIRGNAYIICEIISEKYEDIQLFIHDELGHATTLFESQGGYSGEKRIMIRVVIYRDEENILRSRIAEIDPRAFVCFTLAKAINGEGFEPLKPIPFLKNESKKDSKNNDQK